MQRFALFVLLSSAVLGRPSPAQEPPSQPGRPDAEGQQGEESERKEKPPKPGIPVDEPLLTMHCARCHEQDDRGMMSRISYMRKSPEGWSLTLKRMARLYKVQITADDAREIVRYLANDHGLARGEAERSLYESERRLHWSEEHHDEDLRQALQRQARARSHDRARQRNLRRGLRHR